MTRARATVDAGAIARNVTRLAEHVPAGTVVCAVVKAEGYGHGLATAGRAARAGGARWLAVATAGEAAALRAAGDEGPLLVLGALSPEELQVAASARADVAAWDEAFVATIPDGVGVHVKLDTGLGRLGTRDAEQAGRVCDAVLARPGLALAGAWTHFATADDDPAFLRVQLDRFVPWARAQKAKRPELLVHAANSAALLAAPDAHFDLVRPGVAIYGLDPFQGDPRAHGLEPALALTSYVAALKVAAPGDSAGYGRRWVASVPTWVATLPIGYGDGWRRGLSGNAEVLVGGRRWPLVGTVSMDNVTVSLGPARDGEPAPAAVRDEAVLIGRQGDEEVRAEEVAARLGTINYEVTCGISSRVGREVLDAPGA